MRMQVRARTTRREMRTTQDALVDVRNGEERADAATRAADAKTRRTKVRRCRTGGPSVGSRHFSPPFSHVPRRARPSPLARKYVDASQMHVRRTRAFVRRSSSNDARTCRCLPFESFFSRSVCHVDESKRGRPTPPRRVTASAAAGAAGVSARPNARLERQDERVIEWKEGDVGKTWRGNEGRRERIACRPSVTDAADRPTCHRPAAAQERLSKPRGWNRNRNRRLSIGTFLP